MVKGLMNFEKSTYGGIDLLWEENWRMVVYVSCIREEKMDVFSRVYRVIGADTSRDRGEINGFWKVSSGMLIFRVYAKRS